MHEILNGFDKYEQKKQALINKIQSFSKCTIAVKKKTASNLFRYKIQDKNTAKIYVENFNNIISLDRENLILDVEGLATFEKIVDFCLSQGYLPTVAPELKHITISGAIVGIGIESTSYKYGFVHDGLIEAEVLLPQGQIVVCTADNDYSDLFHALANSYGTLGYILRAKIKIYRAKPFVEINIYNQPQISAFLDNMKKATQNSQINFIEGLIFSENELYLLLGRFIDDVLVVEDIYKNIFYKLVRTKNTIILKTKDYIFRYDPDWFWNIPETTFYNFLRKILPPSLRSSGVYKKYLDLRNRFLSTFKIVRSLGKNEETLIQDWEVEWEDAETLLKYALENIDLAGKPWAIVPIKPLNNATLYPLKSNTLYFNLGCYCSSRRNSNIPYYNTKIMDNFCYSLGGIKMLYSTTFLSRAQFNSYYNGEEYKALKSKYDPENKCGELYQKVTLA